MKTYKIDIDNEIDFLILGVNSHIKLYKLCWEINKQLNTNFIKNHNHKKPSQPTQSFERFTFRDNKSETQYNILSNRCESGYLDKKNKSVNYFILVQGGVYSKNKIIDNLNKISDILLVFEINLPQIDSINSFIIHD